MGPYEILVMWLVWMAWGTVSWVFLKTAFTVGQVGVRFRYYFHWRFLCLGFRVNPDHQQLYVHPIPWLLITITVNER